MATKQADLEKHNNQKAAKFSITRSYKKVLDQEVNSRIFCLKIETLKQLPEEFFFDLQELLKAHTR